MPVAIALSLLAHGGNTLPGDVGIARVVQRAPDAIAGPASSAGDLIGSSRFLAVAAFAVVVALLARGRVPDALVFALCMLLHLLNEPLKWLVDSPRPRAAQVRVTVHASGLGFPSGHAMGAVQLCGGLLLVLDPLLPPRAVRTAVRIVLIAVPVLVGCSRVYVGAHWPSDVVGGWLWGLVCVLLVRAACRRWPSTLAGGS